MAGVEAVTAAARGRIAATVTGLRIACLGLASVTAVTTSVFAHDIPRDVTVQAFVKPEGQHLRLLVRLPLGAITDLEYPRRERDYVDLARVEPALREVALHGIADRLRVYEGQALLGGARVLSVRLSLESDTSFASYDRALAHVTGPRLPDDTTIFWEQGLIDVLLDYAIRSDRSDFSVDAAFDRLALDVLTVLRFMPPGGALRAYELRGDAGLVRLDPRWHQAAVRFVRLGFAHVLDGADHLLFLFCLVIPLRRFRTLISVVTAFTVAHSITLIASACDLAPRVLWFPAVVETLIAVSIVWMALENVVSGRLERRWLMAFGFGLVHGFGLSFALRDTMQFAGSHLLTSLLSFNVGVELGQLLVVALLVPALGILLRHIVAERTGTIVLSALAAHTGWHWMLERAEGLRQFSLGWPWEGAAGLAAAMRLAMVVLIGGAAVWLVVGVLLPLRRAAPQARTVDAEAGSRVEARSLQVDIAKEHAAQHVGPCRRSAGRACGTLPRTPTRGAPRGSWSRLPGSGWSG